VVGPIERVVLLSRSVGSGNCLRDDAFVTLCRAFAQALDSWAGWRSGPSRGDFGAGVVESRSGSIPEPLRRREHKRGHGHESTRNGAIYGALQRNSPRDTLASK
jgi:hypothetical protein